MTIFLILKKVDAASLGRFVSIMYIRIGLELSFK